MSRISTDQATVLQAVVDRIAATVDQFGTSNCVIAEETEPIAEYEGNLLCCVSPMAGKFPEDWTIGGGAEQCHEETGVIISVWSRIQLDRKNRTKAALLKEHRGLLPIKKAVLKSLCGHDLADSDGNNLLTSLMAPLNSKHQRRTGDGKFIGFALSFSTDFLWDLS